jgi:hypothetical protein
MTKSLIPLLLVTLLPLAVSAPRKDDLAPVMAEAVAAIEAKDPARLAKVTAGDPKALVPWAFRPTANGGYFGRRGWKVAVLHAPGESADVLRAVFWGLDSCQSEGDHVHRLVRDSAGWKLGEELPETETFGFRIRDHRITATIDVPAKEVRIKDVVSVERHRKDATHLQFRLSGQCEVAAVTGAAADLPFAQAGGVVAVQPPPGDHFAVTLRYRMDLAHPRSAAENTVTPVEAVLSANWYPSIARLPASNTVTAIVPRGWTAVSQGDLIGRRDEEGQHRFTYRMDVPNCYFTLAAAPYHVYEKQSRGRTYGVYLLEPDPAGAERQLAVIDPAFQLFEKLWGSYTYSHYSIVRTRTYGFGLESYTFTAYGFGFPVPSTNPHEWAHTWWGGYVPCTYLQDMWNEGFARYAESVYYRLSPDQPAPPALRERVYWHRPTPELFQSARLVSLTDGGDTTWGPNVAVGYQKGSLVLQDLERLLGFETLTRCMRAFRSSFPRGEAATWRDFETVVQRVTGKDYRWWFDQWLRRRGLPRLKWENVAARPAGTGYRVTAELVQDGEPYRLAIPISLETRDGRVTRIERPVHAERTRIEINVPAAPRRLLLDPEQRLPRAVSPSELPLTTRAGPRGRLLFIAGAAETPLLDRLRRSFPGAVVKHDVDVTDEDLRGSDVVLLGGAATNRVWARFAELCPFSVDSTGVRFHGRHYAGAQARAVTVNPANPERTITWRSDSSDQFLLPHVTAGVYDSLGRLLDADVATLHAGPGVHEFPPAR